MLPVTAHPTVVVEYFRLFVNRRAYTLQSNRPHPKTGRHYNYRPTDKTTGQSLSLTPATIRRHLEGEITIGLYAINPVNQSCKWVAIDADYQDALADLMKLGLCLKQDGVASALEQSNRGGHLWIFMAESLLARDCRLYVCDLALLLGIPIKHGRQREGIEIFPKHDVLKPGRFGNAIRAPLGIHRGAGRRFWFDGAAEEIGKQIQYLDLLPKLTAERPSRLIAGKAIPPSLASLRPDGSAARLRSAGGSQFRILDYINTPLHVVGCNHVTQCPSCAEEGHERTGDNLSISIEDPRKYICWAGCTSDMIRAAVGYPQPVRHA